MAEPGFVIEKWENEEGLPQNAVIAITQTRDGYLWLGTLNGLVRFDGLRFTVFDESNTPGLPSSRIVSLFEDSRTNLWIGTETASVCLARDGEVIPFQLGSGGREGRLAAVCEDARGAVWLYTLDGQLARYDGEKMDVWRFGAQRPSQLRSLARDDSGLLRVGVDWGLFAIRTEAAEPGTDLPVVHELPVGKLDFLLSSASGGHWRLADGRIELWQIQGVVRRHSLYPWGRAPVATACEDLEGNLVVGTLGAGLFWFGADGQVVTVSTNQGLSHNFVLSLYADREGSLWVGTDGGGLNRVKRRLFDVLAPTRGAVVQSVAEDAEGGLWIGSNGDGVGHWRDGEFERFGSEQGLWNEFVRAVVVDRQERVLAGTWGAGLFERRGDRFLRLAGMGGLSPVVLALFEDHAGQLWLGTQGGLAVQQAEGWKLFTTQDGLTADFVRAFAEGPAGCLWIGTVGGGLNRFENGRFTALRKADGAPSDNVSALWMDAEGVLWVGTDGGGLGRWQAGRWTRYTTREGLISNSVGYLLEDGEGFLWVGSNAGLQRVRKQSLNDLAGEFAAGRTGVLVGRVYGKPDGLPISECTLGSQPAACRSRDGTLWFPTIKGLVSVRPERLVPNQQPPPVLIEAVFVDGQPVQTSRFRASPPQSVTLRPSAERLEIQYTSLNLRAPKQARFRHRLEGHESSWTEAGNDREARYVKIPPGNYRFQVIACNEDGVWNETGSVLAVTVLVPFWRTWWFVSSAILALLGAVVVVVHRVSTERLQRQLEALHRQEALDRDRARIARDIHDQLGASLTQVALLGEMVESDKDSPDEVAGHARQIALTARETTRVLDEIVWTVNPSNDTLEGLINYICKHAQEYLGVAGVRYRLDAPAALPPIPIPPEVRHNLFLAAKEAVTNIVRHAHATEARLRLQLEGGQVRIEIEDNGRGPGGASNPAAQTRNGLKNMRKRLEDIGGSFTLEPGAGAGTLVRLTIPLPSSTPSATTSHPP